MSSYTRADRPTVRFSELPPVPVRTIQDNELNQRRFFVPPTGYDRARKLLYPPQPVLILTGPAGSGKRTMALRLLQERSGRRWDESGVALDLQELVPDWEEPDPGRLPVAREHGYLFDLGRYDQRLVWPFAKRLRDHYAAELNAAGSYLVVTGTDEHWQDWEGVLEHQRIRLPEPAPARSIVEQRIPEDRRVWLNHPTIEQLLAGRLTPADAVRLAEAIEHAPADVQQGPAYARTGYQRGRWWPDLSQWFADHPDPADRALLIAAAVLDGCPADEVWQASRALSGLMGDGAPATGPLAGPGRTRLLEVLGLPELRPDGVVSLAGRRDGFPDAVIDYVVAEHADLIECLWAWIGDAAMTADYVQHRVDRVAHAIAGRSARHGKPVFVTRLPGFADGEPGHRRLARAVLDRTSRDPVIGAPVRRQIAYWAERTGTRDPLVIAIAETCGGALAEEFPVVALATLRRILLRRGSAAVEQAALAALVRLASGPDRRRLVLQVVVRWMSQPAHRYAGGVAFLRLMHPAQGSTAGQLTNQDADDPPVFRLLRCGWQWLPDTGVPDSQIDELMAEWEAAAQAGRLRRDVVADLLLLAVEPDLRRMAAGSPGPGAANPGPGAANPGPGAANPGPGGRRAALVRRILRLR